jgi:hypothetical protein
VESELSEAEAEALAALDADIDGEAIEADELAGDLPTRGDEGDSVEEAVDVGDGDDVVIVEDGVESIRAPQEVPASLPPEVAREAQIAKLLTECDVYLRYGLKQKVVDQLRRVLDIDPSHVEAREKLKDVLVDRGENAAAAAELMVLADLFSAAKPSLASLYLRQAAELDPGNPELEARMASLRRFGALVVGLASRTASRLRAAHHRSRGQRPPRPAPLVPVDLRAQAQGARAAPGDAASGAGLHPARVAFDSPRRRRVLRRRRGRHRRGDPAPPPRRPPTTRSGPTISSIR